MRQIEDHMSRHASTIMEFLQCRPIVYAEYIVEMDVFVFAHQPAQVLPFVVKMCSVKVHEQAHLSVEGLVTLQRQVIDCLLCITVSICFIHYTRTMRCYQSTYSYM